MHKKFAFIALLVLAGCTYPTTTVRTVDARPRIAVANVSPTAMLLVNGVVIGPAAAYDGKKQTLTLDSGTHTVEIQDAGRTVHSEKVFLGEDMLKTITVRN